jgi:6-phosphofructokinase 2
MSTIITITFSPCIDKSTSVQSLIPEKKLVCTQPKLEPGGGGINVARAIKKLGGEATAIFPSGGYTGKFFNHLLQKENIPALIIETVNETRENIIVLDESTNNQYRFGMPGTALQESEWQQCLQKIEALNNITFIIASGSLPPNIPVTIYTLLAKIAKSKNAKFILDTSGESLRKALNEGVYLIKPNARELAMLAGKKEVLSVDEIKQVSKQIIDKGQCEVVVVSMGAEGAMLVTKDITEIIKPPEVKRKSTVGAGDSMVAGIVFCLSQNKNIFEAVQYGVACGTAATMNSGSELCKKEDVDKLLKLIQLEAIQKKVYKDY